MRSSITESRHFDRVAWQEVAIVPRRELPDAAAALSVRACDRDARLGPCL